MGMKTGAIDEMLTRLQAMETYIGGQSALMWAAFAAVGNPEVLGKLAVRSDQLWSEYLRDLGEYAPAEGEEAST